MSDNEQKLVNLCFSIARAAMSPEAAKLRECSTEEQMAWVAEQLRSCGFDTRPIGMSWGILTNRRR